MATSTNPTIAHGIARLHPEQPVLRRLYSWGPAWELPPARTGLWIIDRIRNTAIRVEFDESVPKVTSYAVSDALDEAREALSADDEARRADWLKWADKREAAEFVRKWTARRRREQGDLPDYGPGTYIRTRWSSGVWHIATGRSTPRYTDPDKYDVGVECPNGMTVDIGETERPMIVETTEPDHVCRLCLARIESRQAEAANVAVPA